MTNFKIDELNLRDMLNVQRLSGVTKIKSYNLAEHSFFVALIWKRLCDENNVEVSGDAMTAVLLHDSMEIHTGDLRYTAKNLNEKTKRNWEEIEKEIYEDLKSRNEKWIITDDLLKDILTPVQLTLFKKADILELLSFCISEREIGNNSEGIRIVMKNCISILEDFSKKEEK